MWSTAVSRHRQVGPRRWCLPLYPPAPAFACLRLQISFPPHVLDGFSCHAEEVRATFKYKHLKAAFTNVAQREQWSAKVG